MPSPRLYVALTPPSPGGRGGIGGIGGSAQTAKLVDGLCKFPIKMYTLTTHTHPGKISVTHRFELMLTSNPRASA
jgi:hypothetical protein